MASHPGGRTLLTVLFQPGSEFTTSILKVRETQPDVSEVRGLGMLLGIAFDEPIGKAVAAAARHRGLLVRAGHDFDAIAPPLCTTIAEADEIAEIVATAIADVVG